MRPTLDTRLRSPARVLFHLTPFLLSLSMPLAGQTDPALEHARKLLKKTILIDGHNDLAWVIRRSREHPRDVAAYDLRTTTPGHTDLARLRQGMVGAQFWSIYVPGEIKDSGFARVQLEQFDIARRAIARYPDDLELALSADDVERAWHHHRIASFLGMEGGHVLENSLGALRSYYQLGARYLTLTHNVTLDWADAALDSARHGGLTPFGKDVVHEMNRLGMLVDISHVSDAVMSDVLSTSQAPVIFSHSACRALVNHPRNVPDSLLARLSANGGVVMIAFVPQFVSQGVADADLAERAALARELEGVKDPDEQDRIEKEYRAAHPWPRATLAEVADHIEHARSVAGVDHIGIGSDFDGIDDVVLGLEDVSKFPDLFAELIRRGWKDEELKKLAGGNVLRVLKKAEEVAGQLRGEEPKY